MNEKNLHKYQWACIDHIINTPKCGVFLEMGLGKTVLTLTAINLLMNDYCEVNSVLVIAPKRVVETVWQEEASQWSHLKGLTFSKIIGTEIKRQKALSVKADIYLISRDNIAWLCAYYGGLKLPFDMIVIDELSSFKSYKSRRFRSLKACQPYFNRFVGLTGTPAPNGLIDLWPQIYFMDRGARLGKTISAFRSTYFKPNKTNGKIVLSYVPASKESEQLLYDKIKDICISMKASDYIQLPEKTDNFIKLYLTEELQEKYKEFEKEKVLECITDQGDTAEINVINAAALSNKLLQFANGSVYDENSVAHEIHSIKIDALKEIIENANGKSVLVAYQYRFDCDRLLNALGIYSPRVLKTAQDINDWNSGKIQVLLAHPASAGHGLNLQSGGSIIVWFGLTWSLELYQQFNARLYRQGQKEHVIINHLVMAKTHDIDVALAIKNKEENQNTLMNSIKAKIKKYKELWQAH